MLCALATLYSGVSIADIEFAIEKTMPQLWKGDKVYETIFASCESEMGIARLPE
jgi:hypothetical protein